MWHIPDDATDNVAEHSTRLQPSINLHALVTAFNVQLLWYPMYYSEGFEGSGKPCAVIGALYQIIKIKKHKL